MKISQTYRPVLIATHTINSAPNEPKSALRGLMQRLGLALLACTLVIGVMGSASAGQAQDEAAVRALGDNFAKAFVQKNAEQRASLFAENGTFVTPVGDFLQGRVAMVKDFGPEAQQAVTATTQAAFSNYRIRFIKPDIAVADALLTVRNVNGPDGTVIPAIPINFFYVASRHGNQWLIEDGRAHFAPSVSTAIYVEHLVANRKLCDRAVSYVIEGRRKEDPALSSYLSPACSAKSEMQSGDLDYEDFNERSTQLLVSGFLLPEPGCGAHAKHRYHPSEDWRKLRRIP